MGVAAVAVLVVRTEEQLLHTNTGHTHRQQLCYPWPHTHTHTRTHTHTHTYMYTHTHTQTHTHTHTHTHQSEQLASELEEQKALAEGRLKEIEAMSQQLAEVRKEVERLKLDQQTVSESDVRDSAAYKGLQTQYSIVCQGESITQAVAAGQLGVGGLLQVQRVASCWSARSYWSASLLLSPPRELPAASLCGGGPETAQHGKVAALHATRRDQVHVQSDRQTDRPAAISPWKRGYIPSTVNVLTRIMK